MSPFEQVVLIFNPKSTGDAEEQAHGLARELSERLPDTPVRLSPTEHAGHARDLARAAAEAGGRSLIVSVSGDGGYNEVVDGVMAAGNPDVVTAVLGAGNANDHQRVVADRPLADAIVDGEVRRIDLLRLTTHPIVGDAGAGAEITSRFAHSYIGLGLTPIVAIDLEKGGKGSLGEIIAVVRTFARFRPFTIRMDDGTVRRFDSLLFANINEMAKFATLSDGAEDDGQFEVVTIPHTSKLRILAVALRAALRGLGPQPTAKRFAFTTLKPTPMQLDGELVTLDPGTAVRVEIAPGALTTLGRPSREREPTIEQGGPSGGGGSTVPA